jgi:LPXTG-motif cell wall-anchored protein
LDIELQGNAKIKKVDKTFGTPVSGTKYRVAFSDSTPAKEVTTGADGTAIIEGITSGTVVTVTEISVPEPYVLDSKSFSGTIKAGETITLEQKNYVQPKLPRTGSNHVIFITGAGVLLGFVGIGLMVLRRREIAHD